MTWPPTAAASETSAAMQRADLVAARVAQVRNVELARGALAPAGRILDAFAAIGHARIVERLDQLGAGATEADGAAIGARRRIAIDRLGDAEHAGLCAVEDAPLRVRLAFRQADDAQHGVVEFLGRRKVVGAQDHVRKHSLLPPSEFRSSAPR